MSQVGLRLPIAGRLSVADRGKWSVEAPTGEFAGGTEGQMIMWTAARISRRLGAGLAGAALVVAGFTVVAASNPQVQTGPSSGYPVPPASYDISGGPATVTFTYTVTNLTQSTIDAQVEFDASRIITYEGTDVSTGYPAISAADLAANYADTVQLFDIPKQYQTISVSTTNPLTVTFSLVLDECGYYRAGQCGRRQRSSRAVRHRLRPGDRLHAGSADADPDGDTHAHRHADGDPHADADRDSDRNSDPDAERLGAGNLDRRAHADPNRIGARHLDAGNRFRRRVLGSGLGMGMIVVGAVMLLGALIAGRRLEPV